MKKLTITLLLLGPLLAEKTAFGSLEYNTGFTGNLYNLKADQNGDKTDVNSNSSFYEAFGDLIRKKFSDKALAKFQIADEANDLRYLNVNSMKASEAPTEFGSSYIDPQQIIIVYKGTLESAPVKPIRFAGVFDDAMCVLVNGKVVFYVSRHEDELRHKPKEESNRRQEGGVNYFAYGDYITLKKGDEITLVLAEVPGGMISGQLLIQQKGFRYDEDSHDDPILHPFLCDELERDEKKAFEKKFETRKIPQFIFKKI